MTSKVEIVLQQDKETKGTIRFASKDEEAPIQQVYVDRKFAETLPAPRTIVLTVTAG